MTKNESLLTAQQLATALGSSSSYIYAMKHSGFVFSHGKRTMAAAAKEWLAANPDWRSSKYYHPDGEPARKQPLPEVATPAPALASVMHGEVAIDGGKIKVKMNPVDRKNGEAA